MFSLSEKYQIQKHKMRNPKGSQKESPISTCKWEFYQINPII